MPYDDILCSWLVRSALVSLTILLTGSVAVLMWRQPARRVRIIELVLAGCLIAPWLGMIPGYPQLSVAWWHAAAVEQEAPLPHPEPMTEPAMIEPTIPEPMPLPTMDRATPPVPSTKTIKAPATIEAPAHAFEIRPWIVGVYLAGVAIGIGWWLFGIVGLARILRASQPAPSRCRELLAEISGGRSDRVRLLVSRRLGQPFASAWGRAVIVLPENLCGDEQALRWCLAHEWAHVDSHDFRTWLLAGLARLLFFYQPLLWWLRRQLRLCQDFVADSQAARQAPEVEDYAEFLTARVATGRLHPALGLSMGCRKSELYRRVIMLLKNQPLESRTPRLWTVSITMAALVLVAVVAAVSLVPRAVAEEKPAVSQFKAAGGTTKGLPKKVTVDLGKGVKLEMVLIPAGEFLMGSPDSDKDARPNEKPQHRVRITKPFYLGKYLVTQEQWAAVMGNNPSSFKGPKNPVETVTWNDCQTFIEKLNAKSADGGGKFKLPTEAQWEYACRAGSKTKYCFGDDESKLGDYAWYAANSGDKPHPVGEKKPNAWGLYDMHGGVWEWCQDWWKDGNYKSDEYYKESPVDDPTGITPLLNPAFRVRRGGNWWGLALFCRSAGLRDGGYPGAGAYGVGLRVSRIPMEAVAETRLPSANDHSDKASAAKPADEVSPASGQSATKEGSKADSKAAPIHRLTATPNTVEARMVADLDKLGVGLWAKEDSSGKPVNQLFLAKAKTTDAELAILKRLGLLQVRVLILDRSKVTDAGLANLSGLTNLAELWLDSTNVSDAGLAHLKGLTNLHTLILVGTQVTDAGLVHLEGLTQLQHLELMGTKITDVGLANLKGLIQLKSLNLGSTKVTDAGLKHLKALTNLRTLDLNVTNVTGLHLKELPQLRMLSLGRTKVTDAGLDYLKELGQLEWLSLEGNNQITDVALEHLKGSSQLTTLYLGYTEITDAGLEHLKGFTKLKTLDLGGTKVTDAGVKKLQQALPKCRITFDPAPPKANDQSAKTSAAKPADEVSPASDQPATKDGPKTEPKSAPIHLTRDEAKAIAEIEKLGGKVTFDEKSPGKPVIAVDLQRTKVTDAGLEHLKELTQLQLLGLERTQITDAGLERLEELHQLRYLYLERTQITDAWLEHLKGMSQLEALGIGSTDVSNAGLEHLKELPRLHFLNLFDTRITDAGLIHIEGLTQLHSLNLGQTQITNAGLVHIEGLTQLQSLDLEQTQISNAGLARLKGLTQLQSLGLRETKVTDTGLANLKGLPQLRSLDLYGANVTDAGMERLKGLTKLKTLDLGGTKVTDAGVKKLQQALPKCRITFDPAPPKANDQSAKTSAAKPADEVSPASDQPATKDGPKTEPKSAPIHLTTDEAKAIAEIEKLGGKVAFDEKSPGKPVVSVDLAGTTVTDAGLVHLKELPKFTSLCLDNTQVTDAGLEHLASLAQLQNLQLSRTKITDAGLEHIKGLIKIRWLDLKGTKVTDAGLLHLKGLASIRWLNLEGTKVTDAGLEHLKRLNQMQELFLEGTSVTDAGMGNLKGMSQLERLALDKTKITGAGLENLKGLRQLNYLALSRTGVRDAGLENLKGLNQLQVLRLMNTEVTDTGLEYLKGLHELHNLNLDGTQVTDAGLEHLKGMSKLDFLALASTKVTDAGLEHLKGLSNLRILCLEGTKVTDPSVRKLQEALPNCKIIR